MRSSLRLESAGSLALVFEGEEARVAWGTPDWLGPGVPGGAGKPIAVAGLEPFEGRDDLGDFCGAALRLAPGAPAVRASARAYRSLPLLVFRCEALEDLHGLATGAFDQPALAWPWLRPDLRRAGGVPDGTRAVGHQYTEFALPTFSDAGLAGFFLLPFRPAVVEPLWLTTPDGPCLLLAPLDAFHEQVIAVPRAPERAAEGVRCGWHGDLDAVPAGFASELALFAGPGPRRVLESWGALLQRRAGARRRSRYVDASVSHLSYWTDNGAAYWYRSEPGLDLPTTLERTLATLRAQRVPVRCVELDSWFYPHAQSRSLNPGVSDVPPTGAMAWEPRADLLPDGVDGLRRRLADAPLILHGRHFSSASSYWQRHPAWREGERAHPAEPEAFFDALLSQAASWGAIQYEQDWLVESFLGVRGLREAPGRARRWQEALDAAAGRHGLSLLWCMATPADFMQAVTLERVVAIRASGDYKYLVGSGSLWTWFLHGSALARALGLLPFKDVFLSSQAGEGRDGDPRAEVEALLAALSAGPVGIGDRLGRTDRTLVLRTCREDGRLVKPDVPLAALERCYRAHAVLEPAPLVGEAHSRHPAGCWIYLAALHAHRRELPLPVRIARAELAEADHDAPLLVWDWRRGSCERLEPGGSLDFELAPGAWEYRVLCPVLRGEIAVVGDPARYATAGDARLAAVRETREGVEFDVLGAPGEQVEIAGWSGRPLALVACESGEAHALLPASAAPAALEREAGSGRWRLDIRVPRRGRLRVELAPAAGP
jgi:hypothetical protein